MKEIISDIYKRVVSFFQSDEEAKAKDIACNRLKLVLMHDRMRLDPISLDNLREELIEVISKYIEIDKQSLALDLAGEGDSIALMLNIPVLRTKTKEEIEFQTLKRKTEEVSINIEGIEKGECCEIESENEVIKTLYEKDDIDVASDIIEVSEVSEDIQKLSKRSRSEDKQYNSNCDKDQIEKELNNVFDSLSEEKDKK